MKKILTLSIISIACVISTQSYAQENKNQTTTSQSSSQSSQSSPQSQPVQTNIDTANPSTLSTLSNLSVTPSSPVTHSTKHKVIKHKKVNVTSKKVKNISDTPTSITLEASPTGNAIITDADIYHLAPNQSVKINPNNVHANLSLQNNDLVYDILNIDSPLSTYNFNNLPGLDGQFHLLWIRNDLSMTHGEVFNFPPDTAIKTINSTIPKSFQQHSSGCDAVILSYSLKDTERVTNVINFIQYNQDDSHYYLTTTKPSNCTLQIPNLRDNVTLTNNHLVNIATNPKLANEPSKFGITAHATEEGRLQLLEAEQAILISSDFNNVQFLVRQPQKGSTEAMKSFYGIQYKYDSVMSGDYLVGFSFNEKNKQHWAWGKVVVK